MSEGRLVLVRHRAGSRTYHLLPGGGVEMGETLSEALGRELSEETGLRYRLVRPLFLSDTIDPAGGRHIINITFLGEIVGGELTVPADDPRVEAVELIDPETLPDLDLRPPIAAQLLEAIRLGFTQDAHYLGSLWVEEP
jgi:ADP-ribose pyrophosphatase YjhB (NUDIX family)